MKVIDFFTAHNFLTQLDCESVLAEFDRQMNLGLSAGNSDSLAMIPAFVDVDRKLPSNKPIIVLDAGGTNLRVAILTFDDAGNVTMDGFHKEPMPGADGKKLSADEFFDKMASFLVPVCGKSDSVGFCFSYPTEITKDLDGKLLRWTKQINAPDVVGKMIGSGISDALRKKTGKTLKIKILNDTVATLLAGKQKGMSRQYSSYVGFILGTGTNTAYIESNSKIGKLQNIDAQHSMAINVESGNFNGIKKSDFDEMFDKTTADPGVGLFEKMISGAYMGGLGLAILQTAAKEGFFSSQASDAILNIKNLSTKDFDDFVANPFITDSALSGIKFTDGDRRMIIELGTPVFIRAAIMTAINISAAVLRSGQGKDPLHPVCITIDGSTYYRTRTSFFKSRVEEYLRNILGKRNVYFETIFVEDAPMIGSAVAGLIG